MLLGDTAGASSALQGYFTNQFSQQVSSNGEQPEEASRSRPFHYRCFNIEAMIVSPASSLQPPINVPYPPLSARLATTRSRLTLGKRQTRLHVGNGFLVYLLLRRYYTDRRRLYHVPGLWIRISFRDSATRSRSVGRLWGCSRQIR
jgi:hypothetical protein